MRFHFQFLASAFLCFAAAAFAAEPSPFSCTVALQNSIGSNGSSHQTVQTFLAKNKIPAFLVPGNYGDIPVIFVNKTTEESLKPYINASIGTQIMLKAGWPNNHGGFRLQENIIDAYLPGKRQVGEIHSTGLSWKHFSDSLTFLSKIADAIVEISYLLSTEELEAVSYYQRVLRAALFRTRFSMGDQNFYTQFDNVLQTSVQCFEYSMCTKLPMIIQELQSEINKIESDLPEDTRKQIMKWKPQFLERARHQILTADPYNSEALNQKTTTRGHAGEALREMTPAAMPERKRELYANYLVGLEATIQFSRVRETLGIRDQKNDSDARTSSRASAVLVYLPEDSRAEDFTNARLVLNINGYQLNTTGAKKIPLDHYSETQPTDKGK
jgi:hypothetical protein